MKVEMGKQYKTRDGLDVRIYATDAGGRYPVHGAVLEDGVWCVNTWGDTGNCWGNGSSVNHVYDLFEVKPRIQREMWINIYTELLGTMHVSKESADKLATIGRLACVKLTIDCEEGEGL